MNAKPAVFTAPNSSLVIGLAVRVRATWLLIGHDLSLDEAVLPERGRVALEQSLAFKSFASSVDSAKARELPVTR